jgi:hypothetical protein
VPSWGDSGAFPSGPKFIEVKRTARFREDDITALRLFCADYPQARGLLLYGGHQRYRFRDIDVVPLGAGLKELGERLG